MLSEHVYYVAVAFKMTEKVEQRICIGVSLNLNIPPQKLFRLFSYAHSYGCSYGQLVIGSFIMTMYPLMHYVSCSVF